MTIPSFTIGAVLSHKEKLENHLVERLERNNGFAVGRSGGWPPEDSSPAFLEGFDLAVRSLLLIDEAFATL
jgi:hypothetical protein